MGASRILGGGGVQTYDFGHFSEKLHEIEKIFVRGGGGGGGKVRSRLLDPSVAYFSITINSSLSVHGHHSKTRVSKTQWR